MLLAAEIVLMRARSQEQEQIDIAGREITQCTLLMPRDRPIQDRRAKRRMLCRDCCDNGRYQLHCRCIEPENAKAKRA